MPCWPSLCFFFFFFSCKWCSHCIDWDWPLVVSSGFEVPKHSASWPPKKAADYSSIHYRGFMEASRWTWDTREMLQRCLLHFVSFASIERNEQAGFYTAPRSKGQTMGFEFSKVNAWWRFKIIDEFHWVQFASPSKNQQEPMVQYAISDSEFAAHYWQPLKCRRWLLHPSSSHKGPGPISTFLLIEELHFEGNTHRYGRSDVPKRLQCTKLVARKVMKTKFLQDEVSTALLLRST